MKRATAAIPSGYIFPAWWRYGLIAAATIILCSCNGLPSRSSSAVGPGRLSKRAAAKPSFDESRPSPAPIVEVPAENSSSYTAHVGDDDGQPHGQVIQVSHPAPIEPPHAHQAAPHAVHYPVHHPAPVPHLPPQAHSPPVSNDRQWAPPGVPGPWPRDEYIFDGGDAQPGAEVARDWTVRGLNLADAIGHFDTLDGDTVVVPTNRVPIYAPRFTAVRKVYGLSAHEGHDLSDVMHVNTKLNLHEERQLLDLTTQQIQPDTQMVANSPVTFRDRTRGIGVEKTIRLVANHNGFLPFEDFQVIHNGTFEASEKARLAKHIDAAFVWEDKKAVQVTIQGVQAAVQRGRTGAGETGRYERDKGTPQMRVVKVASKSDAQPGDVIDFTIRFDNIGDELIGNVTLIDNLVARLEYVEDSAECSLNADFFTQENETESLVLRWEVIDPIEPGSGGIIRFKCRVR